MSNYPPQQGVPPGYPQPGYPQPGYPQVGYPPPQPRSGCGGCLGKFLILLGVIFAIFVALCCGGIYYMKSSVSTQPKDVRTITDEIVAIEIPPTLEPAGGGRFQVPLLGKSLGQGAAYADKNKTSLLIVGSFGGVFGEKFKQQFIEAMQSGQFEQQRADKNDKREELKDVKKSRVDRTINGEKAIFDIEQGVGVKSHKAKIRVQGFFEGKTGPAILVIETDADALPEERVMGIIDSMK